ncbi:hypothetical protein [Paracoccus alkanivorans]|uniref:hypothetical protein n=1 Tax=Paracoccus alkanivorans TaxID=2116655 RepID=UPI001AA0460B|nr:hypothetical protein [Paracoccus alkanivorans]
MSSDMIMPSAPAGNWESLSPNERAWIEFIRVISAGHDPAPSPEHIRQLRAMLDQCC